MKLNLQEKVVTRPTYLHSPTLVFAYVCIHLLLDILWLYTPTLNSVCKIDITSDIVSLQSAFWSSTLKYMYSDGVTVDVDRKS